jgi:hypothetical protein
MACIIEDNNPADIIFGCTDPAALNYDSQATVDNSGCIYSGDTVLGCTDPLAINYNPLATWDNGKICIYEDCPTEFTIRPTDGVVFYTSTPVGGGGHGENPGPILITEKGQDPNGGSGNPPVSIPLSENCCTEEVVGEQVIWNGEFCVIPVSGPCPYPLAISIEGVVLGSDGTPVGIECCDTLHHATWESSYEIPGNKVPGACIDNNAPPNEECDLSILDLTLNEDGSVVTTTTTTTIIDNGGEGDTGGDDGGDITTDSCINIDSWLATPVEDIWTSNDPNKPDGVGNGMLIRYETTETSALDLSVGDQISMTGFDVVDPLTTCYNLDRPTLNGYTTVLDVAYNPISGVITITTAIYITELETQQSTCTPNQLIDVSGYGSICLYYGDINGVDTQTCVSTSHYTFQQLSWIYSNFVGPLPSQTEICGTSVDIQNYYLVLQSTDSATLNLTTCDYFDLGDNFKTELSNSCWADEYIVLDDDPANPSGQVIVLQGELDTNFGLVQLLGTGVAGNNYISIYNVSIPLDGANELLASGCDPNGGLPYIGQTCTEGTLGHLTELIDISVDDTPVDNTPVDDGITEVITTEIVNLSELCCDELGSGLWEYIDGVCYWNPPKEVIPVSIGVSENEVIVTDSRCETLTVCMSIFVEQPDDPECFDPDRNISASIGAYSGDIENNIFAVTPTTTYNSLEDGYCNWVTVCGEITNFDGRPFKIKLNLDGILDCCEYDIFIDDISVSCTIQDSIEVSTRNDCPGFNIRKVVDNKKSWVYNDGEAINRVFAPSDDADIPWRYTNYVEQSGVYEKHSKLVLNSKELYLTFNMCSGFDCGSGTTLSVFDLIEYKNNFQSFWVKFMEQFVPATTIFVSGEKWCTNDADICEVIDECGYDNNLDKSSMGTKNYSGGNNTQPPNGSGNKRLTVNTGGNTLHPQKDGDHGSSNDPNPIVFNNFVGSFIPPNPPENERKLTFPKGLVPLLEGGVVNYKNKMKPPKTLIVR